MFFIHFLGEAARTRSPVSPHAQERKYPMKKIALALTLVLASSSLAIGLASTDANAGGRKICKQGLMTHPMAGKHRDLMKQCKAEYKAHKKAGGAQAT
jgi:heme/copper-type cytochrome/quinol oxidase subunit 3